MKQMEFICDKGAYRNFWKPKVTGEWNKDFETGRRYAQQFINCLKNKIVTPFFLALIIQDWPEAKEHTPIEKGFMAEISFRLM